MNYISPSRKTHEIKFELMCKVELQNYGLESLPLPGEHISTFSAKSDNEYKSPAGFIKANRMIWYVTMCRC